MSNLRKRIEVQRRHYFKALKLMQSVINGELEVIDDDTFKPSISIDTVAFQLIQSLNQIKSLLEVEE